MPGAGGLGLPRKTNLSRHHSSRRRRDKDILRRDSSKRRSDKPITIQVGFGGQILKILFWVRIAVYGDRIFEFLFEIGSAVLCPL